MAGISFVALVLLLPILSSCSGSRALTKRAAQLEASGLYVDAANFYFNALLRNNNNVEARVGLSNTSRRVLNDKLDEFSRHRAMEEHSNAFYAYEDAMAYRSRLQRVGVSHDIPQHYEDDFEYSKAQVLRKLYEQSSAMMAEQRFDEAKLKLKEISRIDPNYEDVSELKGVARNEPLYRRAVAHFDAGRYRQAYFELDEIYRYDPDYRDVSVLRAECLNLGTFPVAISPIENASPQRGNDISRRAYAHFVTALTQIDDPFLRIVERENMERILDEQRLSLSGIVDERSASRVGNLLGSKALISATVLSYDRNPGQIRVSEKDAFEAYTVRLYDAATESHYHETRYKPVRYNEYYQFNEVSISIQYKALSLETGEILFSRIFNTKEDDQMYYAAYDGEVNNLFPAGPQGVLTSRHDRQRLQTLIRAPRSIRSIDELTSSALDQAAKSLTDDLISQLDRL